MNYPGKRQVLIFFNESGTALKNKQLVQLNNERQGVSERDIEIHSYNISDSKAKQWKVQPSKAFTFILIGKDGGEKMRSDTVVSTQQLFAIIDAMPMRKEEIKHKP